jgi:protein-disulfide isomerase
MRKPLLLAAGAAVLLAFVLGTLLLKSEKADPAGPPAGRNSANLVRMHSPTLGNADAPVVIVEFLDPACETCRAFYPVVKKLMSDNPGRIRLVLRYTPFHKGSDKVVAMLEAARKQGKFWPALEALLATQGDWAPHHTAQADLAWRHLEGLGLDLGQMRADMASPGVAQVIAQDLADGRALDVTMTPEFFVNGRPLPSFGYEQLRTLVEAALAASPR